MLAYYHCCHLSPASMQLLHGPVVTSQPHAVSAAGVVVVVGLELCVGMLIDSSPKGGGNRRVSGVAVRDGH